MSEENLPARSPINTPADFYGAMDQPLAAAGKMGEMLAKSGMFGCKTPEQGAVLVMAAMMDGISPLEMARRYHIIEGGLSMRADAMQAAFQKAGGRIEWLETNAEHCRAMFYHPIHAKEGLALEVKLKDLVETGVAMDKSGKLKKNYQRHPRQMLRARVISEGVRMVLPECVIGTYTPEETSEFNDFEVNQEPMQKLQVQEKPKPPKKTKIIDAEPAEDTPPAPPEPDGPVGTPSQEMEPREYDDKLTAKKVFDVLGLWIDRTKWNSEETKAEFVTPVIDSRKIKEASVEEMNKILDRIYQATWESNKNLEKNVKK